MPGIAQAYCRMSCMIRWWGILGRSKNHTSKSESDIKTYQKVAYQLVSFIIFAT
jgi:hypothetical protein